MYRYRVMVVDDEPEVVEIITIALREKFDIIPASNGLDALEKLDDFEPDLMISDVMMPLMNGWELITEVRKRPDFQQMSVIFLTALNARKDIMAGYQAGVDLYLTKPFDPLRVRKNIDVFIEKTPPPHRARKFPWDVLTERLRAKKTVAAHGAVEEEAPPAPRPQFDLMPRLFIVDDDEELLGVLRIAFEDHYEVFTSLDGLDAVKKIPHYQPDIFIIDGMLPKMTGYQLCDTLRRSAAYRESPIVFISAKADPKTRETMKRFGLVDYLAKPFDAPQLEEVLNRIIGHPAFKPRPKKHPQSDLEIEERKTLDERRARDKQKKIQESKDTLKGFVSNHEGEPPTKHQA